MGIAERPGMRSAPTEHPRIFVKAARISSAVGSTVSRYLFSNGHRGVRCGGRKYLSARGMSVRGLLIRVVAGRRLFFLRFLRFLRLSFHRLTSSGATIAATAATAAATASAAALSAGADRVNHGGNDGCRDKEQDNHINRFHTNSLPI